MNNLHALNTSIVSFALVLEELQAIFSSNSEFHGAFDVLKTRIFSRNIRRIVG